MAPRLDVDLTEALIDEPLTIRVTGLEPGQRATIRSRFGGNWTGEATFRADESGMIDVTEQAPIGGDYEDVRPMGLIQFARPTAMATPASVAGSRSVERGYRLTLTVNTDDQSIDSTTVVRRTGALDVNRVAIETCSDRFVGDLWFPPGEKSRPGIIYLGGSEGGIPTDPRVQLLASHGYAVLALAYVRPTALGTEPDGDRALSRLPERLVEIPMEYIEDAFKWFADHDRVDRDQVGVIGVSRGTEPAVIAAARTGIPSSVVLVAPSAYAFASHQELGAPVWTRDGEALPYLTPSLGVQGFVRYGWRLLTGGGMPFHRSYRNAVRKASEEEREAAALPVEDIDGKLLCLAGEDDELSPVAFMADRIRERLTKYGQSDAYVCHRYDDAGHLISVPYRPVKDRMVGDVQIFFGLPLSYGGTADGYVYADVDSWDRLRTFLDRNVRTAPKTSVRSRPN